MGADSEIKTVSLRGAYAIDRAVDLARELGDVLAKSRIVHIDLSEVEELDLPAIQVLYAAAGSALARGGALRFVGTASAALCSRLISSGFSIAGPLSGPEFLSRLPSFPESRP
ncbi:MAG: STAS domain-containing protein [Spirochaetes bacterium]|nr:STAS domain-containing protein [Spirochaetota bacterium]MBU1079613.1 STAS domain-containing protein [Spirochaetota bacterium]